MRLDLCELRQHLTLGLGRTRPVTHQFTFRGRPLPLSHKSGLCTKSAPICYMTLAHKSCRTLGSEIMIVSPGVLYHVASVGNLTALGNLRNGESSSAVVAVYDCAAFLPPNMISRQHFLQEDGLPWGLTVGLVYHVVRLGIS